MIGKEEFIELINSHDEQNKRIELLSKVFTNSFGDPIIDWGFIMFDNLLEAYFDKEGVEWVQYYLYENPEHRYYQGGKEYSLNTLDDLWKIVKDNRK